MARRRIAALALSGALVAGGAGAAIAAVTKDDHEKAEQTVLADAAKRLNVTPEKLRDALSQAQDAQIDQAVKDGKLTEKRAQVIKAKRNGRVLGRPVDGPRVGGPHVFRRGSGPRPFGPKRIGNVAKALGLSDDKLFEQLRDGKSIAAIAKAQGKSLDDVGKALKAGVKSKVDKAVKDGDLTRTQADAILARTDRRIEKLKSGKGLRLHRHLRGEMPPAPKLRPGGLELPGEGPPKPVAPEAFFG